MENPEREAAILASATEHAELNLGETQIMLRLEKEFGIDPATARSYAVRALQPFQQANRRKALPQIILGSLVALLALGIFILNLSVPSHYSPRARFFTPIILMLGGVVMLLRGLNLYSRK